MKTSTMVLMLAAIGAVCGFVWWKSKSGGGAPVVNPPGGVPGLPPIPPGAATGNVIFNTDANVKTYIDNSSSELGRNYPITRQLTAGVHKYVVYDYNNTKIAESTFTVIKDETITVWVWVAY